MKITRYCKILPGHPGGECLTEAAVILRWGGTVAFPTETVYGLGANALNPAAVAKIFAAKGRPSDNPLIVHIACLDDLDMLVSRIPPAVELLVQAFWPGPLTLVLPKRPGVPDVVTAGLDTVGVRMPAHPVALALLEKSRVPVAAPSANLSGRPSPTTGLHVLKDLAGKVDLVLDAGECQVGVESTVLDLTTNPPMILRPGGITKEELEEVIGPVALDPALSGEASQDFKPKAPGMKYTHYAPKAKVTVVVGLTAAGLFTLSRLVQEARDRGLRVGLLLTAETARAYRERRLAQPHYLEVLGSQYHLEEIASRLYGALRNCDRYRLDVVYAEGVPPKGLGLAIMNRLTKAAGRRILRV
ncbi:MAG TPA: threonylcarbamoyl-AMP synthase [Clostridia bacterium]|nr:threonylcarbamoyl-AMP synthase [Clostridia bacterium]